MLLVNTIVIYYSIADSFGIFQVIATISNLHLLLNIPV